MFCQQIYQPRLPAHHWAVPVAVLVDIWIVLRVHCGNWMWLVAVCPIQFRLILSRLCRISWVLVHAIHPMGHPVAHHSITHHRHGHWHCWYCCWHSIPHHGSHTIYGECCSDQTGCKSSFYQFFAHLASPQSHVVPRGKGCFLLKRCVVECGNVSERFQNS